MRLWDRCFPVNFAKFLRITFLQNTSRRLLLLYWIFLACAICEPENDLFSKFANNCFYMILLFQGSGVFKTLSNILDGVLGEKWFWRLLPVNYFYKKLHLRCLSGIWIRLDKDCWPNDSRNNVDLFLWYVWI